MIVRYPQYYEEFSCIADKCEDTCCAGWEIDIDEKSYQYYCSIPGEYGRYIRSRIKEYPANRKDVYETHGFTLQEDKRCPFLNERNLCDMILTLGEDAICDVCKNTPRNFLEYGNAREISISPSCAEAGRLLFGSRQPVRFIEKQTDEELTFRESQEDLYYSEIILCARNQAITILQNRALPFSDRMCEFIQFAWEVQMLFQQEDYEKVKTLAADWKENQRKKAVEDRKEDTAVSGSDKFYYFQKRMEAFQELESISGEWEQYLFQMRKHFLESTEARKSYLRLTKQFSSYIQEQDREYEYEQLVVYYAFLLLSRSINDLNFWEKAQLTALSFLMVRDMDLERFYQKGSYDAKDRVDVARIYAKEIEHSEENLEYLYDEFLFGEIYHVEDFYRQI